MLLTRVQSMNGPRPPRAEYTLCGRHTCGGVEGAEKQRTGGSLVQIAHSRVNCGGEESRSIDGVGPAAQRTRSSLQMGTISVLNVCL